MISNLKWLAASAVIALSLMASLAAKADEATDQALDKRFQYLSTNGNSNCSAAFLRSISTMPIVARLQGSCCSPMEAKRYREQIEGLKKYAAYSEIPADPYDIEAGIAQKLLAADELELTSEEQAAYDYAMSNSEEKGPCCCRCWRWRVYSGLAKTLVHDRHFTGEQVTEVWNLSNGCGGAG